MWAHLILVLAALPAIDVPADVRDADPPLTALAPFVRADHARWAYGTARDAEQGCDELAAGGPEEWRECWAKRSYAVYVQRLKWGCLADAWDETRAEADRRRSLRELRDRLGPEDFYRGVMPPPLPPWAIPPR